MNRSDQYHEGEVVAFYFCNASRKLLSGAYDRRWIDATVQEIKGARMTVSFIHPPTGQQRQRTLRGNLEVSYYLRKKEEQNDGRNEQPDT